MLKAEYVVELEIYTNISCICKNTANILKIWTTIF